MTWSLKLSCAEGHVRVCEGRDYINEVGACAIVPLWVHLITELRTLMPKLASFGDWHVSPDPLDGREQGRMGSEVRSARSWEACRACSFRQSPSVETGFPAGERPRPVK